MPGQRQTANSKLTEQQIKFMAVAALFYIANSRFSARQYALAIGQPNNFRQTAKLWTYLKDAGYIKQINIRASCIKLTAKQAQKISAMLAESNGKTARPRQTETVKYIYQILDTIGIKITYEDIKGVLQTIDPKNLSEDIQTIFPAPDKRKRAQATPPATAEARQTKRRRTKGPQATPPAAQASATAPTQNQAPATTATQPRKQKRRKASTTGPSRPAKRLVTNRQRQIAREGTTTARIQRRLQTGSPAPANHRRGNRLSVAPQTEETAANQAAAHSHPLDGIPITTEKGIGWFGQAFCPTDAAGIRRLEQQQQVEYDQSLDRIPEKLTIAINPQLSVRIGAIEYSAYANPRGTGFSCADIISYYPCQEIIPATSSINNPFIFKLSRDRFINPGRKRSAAALANHSSTPNCALNRLNGDKIALRALRDIQPGEQLLVDYSTDYTFPERMIFLNTGDDRRSAAELYLDNRSQYELRVLRIKDHPALYEGLQKLGITTTKLLMFPQALLGDLHNMAPSNEDMRAQANLPILQIAESEDTLVVAPERDQQYLRSLMIDCLIGTPTDVANLLLVGANPNLQLVDSGLTACHFVLARTDSSDIKQQMLRILFRAGANFEIESQGEKSLLHHCLDLNDLASATTMLELFAADQNGNKANTLFEHADRKGYDPILYAIKQGKPEFLDLFLRYMSSPSDKLMYEVKDVDMLTKVFSKAPESALLDTLEVLLADQRLNDYFFYQKIFLGLQQREANPIQGQFFTISLAEAKAKVYEHLETLVESARYQRNPQIRNEFRKLMIRG